VGKWLLVLFTVVPLVETFLLYVMGQALGFWWTIAFMIVTAALGTYFGKREGLKVWREWRESLARGSMPEEGILGGVLVLVGAVLLVTPGVLTDITGLALLIPVSRRFIGKHVRAYLEKKFLANGGRVQYRVEFGDAFARAAGGRSHGDFIETEGEVIEERRRSDARPALEES
jgi:UPF0716 protein FxsA